MFLLHEILVYDKYIHMIKLIILCSTFHYKLLGIGSEVTFLPYLINVSSEICCRVS